MISAKSISLVASDFSIRLEGPEPESDLLLVILVPEEERKNRSAAIKRCSDSRFFFRGGPPRRRRPRRRYTDASSFVDSSMFLYRRMHDNLEKLWTKVRQER